MRHSTRTRLWLCVYSVCTLALQAESWKLPSAHMRYDQVSFLTAHNAFTYRPKWIYAQQHWNYAAQLNNGIRGLMLDVHEENNTLKLCHGDKNKACDFPYNMQKIGNFDTFKEVLQVVYQWLTKNKQEVVTLFLEDYVDTRELLTRTIESIPGLAPMILSPNNWNPANNGHVWPTLAWMQRTNKRLVIFSDKAASTYMYYIWQWVVESEYGSFDMNTVCTERSQSKRYAAYPRALYLLNWFGTPSNEISCMINNTESKITTLIKKGTQKKVANGRLPNFVALDFVNIGGGMEVINALNRAPRT